MKIVDREYSTVNTKLNNGQNIRYSVGQGMGLFTSWPMMAITHHYIVNGICGIPFDSYSLVGDDLIVKNYTKEYNQYLRVMKSIGLEVNMNKTLESENESSVTAEFACNFIVENIPLTPLNFGILMAWNDGKAPFDAFLYAIKDAISISFLKSLLINFELTKNIKDIIFISYFF